jgi:hypothetical protein
MNEKLKEYTEIEEEAKKLLEQHKTAPRMDDSNRALALLPGLLRIIGEYKRLAYPTREFSYEFKDGKKIIFMMPVSSAQLIKALEDRIRELEQ